DDKTVALDQLDYEYKDIERYDCIVHNRGSAPAGVFISDRKEHVFLLVLASLDLPSGQQARCFPENPMSRGSSAPAQLDCVAHNLEVTTVPWQDCVEGLIALLDPNDVARHERKSGLPVRR